MLLRLEVGNIYVLPIPFRHCLRDYHVLGLHLSLLPQSACLPVGVRSWTTDGFPFDRLCYESDHGRAQLVDIPRSHLHPVHAFPHHLHQSLRLDLRDFYVGLCRLLDHSLLPDSMCSTHTSLGLWSLTVQVSLVLPNLA